MSRPFHRQTAGLRLQAALFFSAWLLGPAAVVLAVLATLHRDLGLLIATGILLLSFAIVGLINLIEGSRTRCAVCSAALFGSNRSSKHRAARKLAGSYKLLIARDVLFQGRYRCQHCNERVVCRESERTGPKRVKFPGTRPATLPRLRSAAPGPLPPKGTRGDRITKPDDSPTLPA